MNLEQLTEFANVRGYRIHSPPNFLGLGQHYCVYRGRRLRAQAIFRTLSELKGYLVLQQFDYVNSNALHIRRHLRAHHLLNLGIRVTKRPYGYNFRPAEGFSHGIRYVPRLIDILYATQRLREYEEIYHTGSDRPQIQWQRTLTPRAIEFEEEFFERPV